MSIKPACVWLYCNLVCSELQFMSGWAERVQGKCWLKAWLNKAWLQRWGVAQGGIRFASAADACLENKQVRMPFLIRQLRTHRQQEERQKDRTKRGRPAGIRKPRPGRAPPPYKKKEDALLSSGFSGYIRHSEFSFLLAHVTSDGVEASSCII